MSSDLPLKEIRVLECTHAVMGPSAGLVLADLGAEVIRIEPPEGDSTRHLKGFGSGYYSFYNRNKKNLFLNLKAASGKKIFYDLVATSDVVIENFGPGTMDRLKLGYHILNEINPKLIYCSLKGFLSGPYESRHAMDEVVQMMGGLAYMTGPSGQPLRAGASVIDVTGGLFGVIGVLAALHQRTKRGRGGYLCASLFESTAFLMGQHMAYAAQVETPIPPMPERQSAWAIYQVFETQDRKPLFLGIISDKHWQRFCVAFDKEEWLQNSAWQTNSQRIDDAKALLSKVSELIKSHNFTQAVALCEKAQVPFAPVARPEDLFSDPQLNTKGGLLPISLANGKQAPLPALPMSWEGERFPLRNQPPGFECHAEEILQEIGIDHDLIKSLNQQGVLGFQGEKADSKN